MCERCSSALLLLYVFFHILLIFDCTSTQLFDTCAIERWVCGACVTIQYISYRIQGGIKNKRHTQYTHNKKHEKCEQKESQKRTYRIVDVSTASAAADAAVLYSLLVVSFYGACGAATIAPNVSIQSNRSFRTYMVTGGNWLA